MPTPKFNRPRLPTHYYIWFEPPDRSGDEVLRFASARRRIKLKGHSFREFQQLVIPLLDGRHTLPEIEARVAEVFAPRDLEAGLQLLADHNLLQDAGVEVLPDEIASRLAPQLNFFHELDMNAEEMQARFMRSTVTIFGLSGPGAGAALALAAAGIGHLRCIDALTVSLTDTYLSPSFSQADIGESRTAVVARKISESAPEVEVTTHNQAPENDDDVLKLIEGSDFVINCLDQGQSSLVYKLNRACLQAGIRWTSGATEGTEVVIGPTVVPFETACYLCYKMRTVACAGNPEDEFAFESFLDRRKQDDSGRRENLVVGVGLAASLLSLEAMKAVSANLSPSAIGKIVVFDLLSLESSKHVVLRKPWCPACFKSEGDTSADKTAP
ncbi:MAG: Molybdopterin biosynthesis protein MoeB [Acidobacteria bacterium]|nr:Molybdopterin biosynthesis protein MoeB [Acidobacteriota bacterium]